MDGNYSRASDALFFSKQFNIDENMSVCVSVTVFVRVAGHISAGMDPWMETIQELRMLFFSRKS